MSKKVSIQTVSTWVSTFLAIGGVVLTVANFVIAFKLYPISAQLIRVTDRIEAAEKRDDEFVTRKEIEPVLKMINDNVNRLLNVYVK